MREGSGLAWEAVMRWSERGRTYEDRNRILKTLGFSSYAEYQRSPLWAEVREKVFQQKGRKCFMCGFSATQVHHNRYHPNDFLGKRTRFLNPVCGSCHVGIEFDGERKVSLAEAKVAFQRKRKAHVQAEREAEDLIAVSAGFYYEQNQHLRSIRDS
jgi:hypothetical protein